MKYGVRYGVRESKKGLHYPRHQLNPIVGMQVVSKLPCCGCLPSGMDFARFQHFL